MLPHSRFAGVSFGGVSQRWAFCFALVLAIASAGVRAGEVIQKTAIATTPTIWRLDDLKQIGGQTPRIEGAPKVVRDPPGGPAMVFDGKRDGLILPANPLAGWSHFTIEILFSPASDGEPEQRFLHLQDGGGRRALLETRLNKTGGWWLDTYLRSGENYFTAIDPTKVHRTDRWYWAAMRYDGKIMASFVNGEKQIEGEVHFNAMGAGETSLGVRLNRVFWFKGAIREVRFHSTAIAPAALQRVRD